MSDTFILNGKETGFEPGQMILEAARKGGIEIPTLCYLKGASPTGACRICLIEVKGARSLMAACSTPVSEGMEVFTDTELCLLYTSPSPRDGLLSRMPSSA